MDSQLARIHELEAQIRTLIAQLDDALRRVDETGSRVAALTKRLTAQRLIAANAARERDDITLKLLAAQAPSAPFGRRMAPRRDLDGWTQLSERCAELDDELAQRNADIARRDSELEAIKATLSWRITRPLRRIRSLTARKRGI